MTTSSMISLGFLFLGASCAPSHLDRSRGIDQPQIYSLPQHSLCAIVGRVTEWTTSEPVAGSTVITAGDRHGTVTDHLGNFSISDLASGTYRIRASSIGHEPAESDAFFLKANEPKQAVLSHPVEWQFESRGDKATLVRITNSGFTGSNNDEIVAKAIDSMGGFTSVLADLKAYLEHGIQLNLVADHDPDSQRKT